MDWGPIIAAAVTGLAAGVVGSLIAPWVQLAVENRRNLRERRQRLIDNWRAMLAKYHRPAHVSLEGLVDDSDFLSLRQHLDPDLTRRLETQSGTTEKPVIIREGAQGIAVNADLVLLANEVDRLEREWKLA
jgi:hypothetical protein